MVALIGSLVAFVAFGAILKLTGQRRLAPAPVAAINYVVASVVCALVAARDPSSFAQPAVWLLGTATGAGFAIGFFIYFRAIERAGLSVAQPVVGMAVLVPTLASIIFWSEQPSALQVVAMLGVCAAMALLSTANGGAKSGTSGAPPVMLLLALFIIQGLTYLSPKVLDEWGYAAQRWAYLAVLFGAAGIGSTWRWLRSGERTTRLGVALGFGLGASNIAATALQLAAIAALPGIIVFPVTSLGPMALGTALGIVVWGERPARRALAGALIALPAVLLLSL